jgi:hypothetical protein
LIPNLSPAAWALLGVLHRASQGGPQAPAIEFDGEYAELRGAGLVATSHPVITEAGEEALREYLFRDDV